MHYRNDPFFFALTEKDSENQNSLETNKSADFLTPATKPYMDET